MLKALDTAPVNSRLVQREGAFATYGVSLSVFKNRPLRETCFLILWNGRILFSWATLALGY